MRVAEVSIGGIPLIPQLPPSPPPAFEGAALRAQIALDRDLQGMVKSMEFSRDVALLQRDALQGLSPKETANRLWDLSMRANDLPPAWRGETQALITDVGQQMISTPDPQDAKIEALFSAIRGVPAGGAESLVDLAHGYAWAEQVKPVLEQQAAAREQRAYDAMATLLDSTSQSVAQLQPSQPAPAPGDGVADSMDQASAAVEAMLASVGLGGTSENAFNQPTVASGFWGPTDAQRTLVFGGGRAATVNEVLRAARSQLGVRYALVNAYKPGHWIDCSALVQYSFRQAGITVGRTTWEQWGGSVGQRVDPSQVRRGDAVYFDNGAGRQPGHVGIYAGDGMLIIASSGATKVIYQPLSYWRGKIIGVKRFIP